MGTDLGSGAGFGPGNNGPAPPAAFNSSERGSSGRVWPPLGAQVTSACTKDTLLSPAPTAAAAISAPSPNSSTSTVAGLPAFAPTTATCGRPSPRQRAGCATFQRNTDKELTNALDTHLSWIPTVNTDPPQFDGETNIGPFRIYVRLVHYDLMCLGLGHGDGNEREMACFGGVMIPMTGSRLRRARAGMRTCPTRVARLDRARRTPSTGPRRQLIRRLVRRLI